MIQPYEMIPLRRDIGIFRERGGTIGWLANKAGTVVVDTQFPEQAGHFLAELRNIGQVPIDLLINTHHHGDHTGGNVVFKDIAGKILAHENSKINQMNTAAKNGNEAEQVFPTATFGDRWQQEVGKEIVDLQYWGPAHTNGDAIIHFQKANIVHCGDLVFNRRYPYIDKAAGARIDNWIEILQQMQAYFDRDTLFIFGHAREGFPVTGDKTDLAAFADYLTALLEHVGTQLAAGRTKEEVLATTAIPGAPEWTGDGIQRSLNAAIEELMEAKN
jgi:glyoxylase-like metal-dependent hydrolase (beta-lactamase superfamily II)